VTRTLSQDNDVTYCSKSYRAESLLTLAEMNNQKGMECAFYSLVSFWTLREKI